MSLIAPHTLAERAAEARGRLRACDLCALGCGVNRLAGERGVCGLGDKTHWFREMTVFGIELELIPAHAIYLTGCNIRCAHCNVAERNLQPEAARPWDGAEMAGRVALRRREGARTLLLLGGEPTVNLPALLEMLAALPERPPVAWDSNMLLSPAARALLEGVVETYVADLKFGNDACARALAGIDQYLEILEENLRFAERTARLIVRHLMLPGHFDCCTAPALRWLAARLERPRLSLRWEYLPPTQPLPDRRLNAQLPPGDVARARDLARELSLELSD